MNRRVQNILRNILPTPCWNILDYPMILSKFWNGNSIGNAASIPSRMVTMITNSHHEKHPLILQDERMFVVCSSQRLTGIYQRLIFFSNFSM
jgi:hypothetical protein